MELALLFYSLTVLTVGGVVLSYAIAYKLTKSMSILSLLLFFIAVFSVVLVITVNIGREILDMSKGVLPFIEIRSAFFFLTSVFLFYTTWKKQDKKIQ